MTDFRSSYRSYGGGDRKLEIVNRKAFNAKQTYLPRPYSTDWELEREQEPSPYPPQGINRVSKRYRSSSKSWSFRDPEMKRRKRVAKYKAYAFQGKVKSSLRKGIRWIKIKCSYIIHGHGL